MELRLLRTFVAVAELRHFARAADRCHLSQPAVSHQIRLLEGDVGARLLNRDGRRVSLTLAGEQLLEDARRILAAVERARERVQGVSNGARGRVRIGATETPGLYLLPPVLDRFRRAYPRFALHVAIAPEAAILERVASNDLDMGVLAGRPVLGDLRARGLGRDDLVIIAAAGAPIAARRRVAPRDLRDEPWILREEGSDTRRQFDAWIRRHRLAPSRVITVAGPDGAKRAAIAGLGLALVARSAAAEDLAAGRVAAVAAPGPPPRAVWLVDHPNKHHGAACTAMIELLMEGRG